MKGLIVVVCAVLFTKSQGRGVEDGRLVAAYSTRTVLTLTTITSEHPLTCVVNPGIANCGKRRFRRYRISIRGDFDEKLAGLESSLDEEDLEIDEKSPSSSTRDGRIALTVWTTSSSTFTITSTSVNTSTTFSLSYYCTVAGASFPPACG
ncbi:uncharacterized protein [Palaemon carinicauda]|uniref:uncharacterized protein n=1 Tax=Palaemon carinicauda TaxID=392227 RepID=UPI0035B611B6